MMGIIESPGFDNLAYIYYFASAISSKYQIRCPHIFLTSKSPLQYDGKSFRGITENTKTGNPETEKALFILLDGGLSEDMLLHDLAHEMRHVWQRAVAPARYFSNYTADYNKIGFEKYWLQPAEIDANAFADLILKVEYNLSVNSDPIMHGGRSDCAYVTV